MACATAEPKDYVDRCVQTDISSTALAHPSHVNEEQSALETATETAVPRVQCEDLKKGGYTVIKGRPCKIVDMTRGRAGHGIKVYIVAIDIFTGLKLELGAWSTEEMEVQEVLRTESTLVAVADGFLRLLDQDGAPRDDVRFPKGDLGTVIQAGISAGKTLLVTVVSAMGETAAISVKEPVPEF